MWACPCTTCGGRGFSFDIHPILSRWECVGCRFKWTPPDGNYKPSNCKCPQCGCTQASGWFDDEFSEEEIEAMSDEEYEKHFGISREAERKMDAEIDERMAEKEAEEIASYDPEKRAGEVDENAERAREEGDRWRRDDVDFPRNRSDEIRGATDEDDIPF